MRLAAETLGRVAKSRDQCVLRIRGASDPDAARRVLEGLNRLVPNVLRSGATTSFISEVVETPEGPMILMDAKDLTEAELSIVLNQLVQSAIDGLDVAVLEVPQSSLVLEDLETVRFAVIGSVMPAPLMHGEAAQSVPGAWCQVAANWLRGAGRESLSAKLLGVDFPMPWADMEAYLEGQLEDGFFLSSGTVSAGLRAVAGVRTHGRLAFLAAGPSPWPDDLSSEAQEIRHCVRECAPEASYALVTPIDRANHFGRGDFDLPQATRRHPGAGIRFRYLSDVAVLDAFWYQIVGTTHLERTGPLPESREVAPGRFELQVGEFNQWLSPDTSTPLRDYGRELLSGCFLSRAASTALWRERAGR